MARSLDTVEINNVIGQSIVKRWKIPRLIAVAGKIGHGKDTIAGLLQHKFGYTVIPFAEHLRRVCMLMLAIPREHLTDRELRKVPLVRIGPDYNFPFDVTNVKSIEAHLMSVAAFAFGVPYDLFASARHRSSYTIKLGFERAQHPSSVLRSLITLFNQHIYVPMMNGRAFTGREIMQLAGTEIFRTIDPDIWTRAWRHKAEQEDLVVVPDLRFPNEHDLVKSMGGVLIKVVRPQYLAAERAVAPHVSETMLDNHAFDFTLSNSGTIADLWNAMITPMMEDFSKKDVDSKFAKVVTL